jgi:hypothetical protein
MISVNIHSNMSKPYISNFLRKKFLDHYLTNLAFFDCSVIIAIYVYQKSAILSPKLIVPPDHKTRIIPATGSLATEAPIRILFLTPHIDAPLEILPSPQNASGHYGSEKVLVSLYERSLPFSTLSIRSTQTMTRESPQHPTDETDKTLTKHSSCANLLDTETIDYEIATSDSVGIQLRLTDYSGNGYFRNAWLSLDSILESL